MLPLRTVVVPAGRRGCRPVAGQVAPGPDVGALLDAHRVGCSAAATTFEAVGVGREFTVTVLAPAPPAVLLGGVDGDAAYAATVGASDVTHRLLQEAVTVHRGGRRSTSSSWRTPFVPWRVDVPGEALALEW